MSDQEPEEDPASQPTQSEEPAESTNQIEGDALESPRGSPAPAEKKAKSDYDDIFGEDEEEERKQKEKEKEKEKENKKGKESEDEDDLFGDDDANDGFFKGFDFQHKKAPAPIIKKRSHIESEDEDEDEDDKEEKTSSSKPPQKHQKKQKREEEKEKKEFANELEEVEYRVRMSKKRKANNDPEYYRELGVDGVMLMDNAFIDDDELIKNGRPATKKLLALKKIEKIFLRKEVLNNVVKSDFLRACHSWLLPLKAGLLPSLEIRTFILKILSMFEMDDDNMSDLLKSSKVGNVVMYLLQHPQETFENKRTANQLVYKWSRAVFNTPGESSDPSQHERVEVKKKKAPVESVAAEPQSSGSLSFIDENPDDNMKYQRARIPVAPVFNFKVRPVSEVEVADTKQSSKKGATGETAISRMKAASGNKPQHALSMSVEGRGLK